MDRFLEVRQRWDPERVFLNRFLEEEIFHLAAHSRPTQRQPTDPPASGLGATPAAI
jgi:hypothetical protein